MSTLRNAWTRFWRPAKYPPDSGQWRGQIKYYLERGDQRTLLIWEIAMAIATIAYVALAFLAEAKGQNVAESVLWGFVVLFAAEFVVRFANAPDRAEYLSQHWIDAVTAIPQIGYFRVIRLLRLIRLFGMMRLIAAIDRATGHRGWKRTSFWFLGPLLLLVWVGSADALWEFEYPDNHDMRNFLDALYMAFGAATSFGYQRVKPVTPGGQVIAGLLIFVGLGLVTFASSQLTSKLLRQPDVEEHLAKVAGHLAAIDQSIAELKAIQNPAAERPPDNAASR